MSFLTSHITRHICYLTPHTPHLLLFTLFCLFITSCEIEMSDNGKLDGNWQLRQIDTLATNGTCDMTYSSIYWGIENDLLQVRDIDNNNQRILFRFKHQGDSLILSQPYNVITKDELEALENDSLLRPLGICGTEEHFLIEQLNSSNLTLKNPVYRLWFRKY